ncbi:MAG: translocation/assembly module TamB domain-containing protein [Gammaproteobacteria bacterium]
MTLKNLLRLILFILAVVLILLGLLTSLAMTQAGSHWLVRWLIETNEIPLKIEKLQGRLADNIRLEGVQYANGEFLVTVEAVELAWKPAALLQGTASIEKILIEKPLFRVLPIAGQKSEPMSFDFRLPEIEPPDLPVGININQISLISGSYHPVSGETINVDIDAALTVDASGMQLHLKQFLFAEQSVSGSVLLASDTATPINVALSWSGVLDEHMINGMLELSGPQHNLAFTLETGGGLETFIQGQLQLAATPYAYTISGETGGPFLQSLLPVATLLAPVTLDISGDQDELQATLAAGLNLNDMATSLNTELYVSLPGKKNRNPALHVEWESVPAEQDSLLALSGIGDFELDGNRLTLDHLLQGPGKVRLAGVVSIDDLHSDLLLEWDELQFPTSNIKTWSVPYGKLALEGKPDALRISMQSAYRYEDKTSANPNPMEGNIDAEGSLDMSGDVPAIDMQGSLVLPLVDAMQGHVNSLSPLNFELDAANNLWDLAFQLSATTPDNKDYTLTVTSDIDLQNEVSASIDWDLAEKGTRRNVISGTGNIVYEADTLTIQHASATPYNTRLNGKIGPVTDGPAGLDITLKWDDIALEPILPALTDPTLGQVSVTGNTADMQIQADAELGIAPLGPVNLSLVAALINDRLAIDKIRLGVLQGEVNAQGELLLAEELTGQLQLQARQLDFASINPDLKSAINMDAVLTLSQVNQQLQLGLSVPDLSGSWRDRPLQGNAEIVASTEQVDVRPFRIELQDNVIELNMTSTDSLTGNIVIDLEDLASFSNELAGSVKGDITLGGTRLTPGLNAELTGSNLYYDNWRIGQLMAAFNIDLVAGHESKLRLNISTLQYADTVIDNVEISGGGLTENHQLSITASGEQLQLQAQLEAALRQQRWTGVVSDIMLNSRGYGEWHLAQPLNYYWQVDSSAFAVNESCFNSASSSLCLQAVGDEHQQVNAQIVLERLPLNYVNQLLPTTLSLQGQTGGKLVYTGDSNDWLAKLDLSASDARLGIGFADEVELVDLSRATVAAEFGNTSRKVALALVAPSYFDLDMSAQIASAMDAPLAADLKLRLPDIRWLEKVEPALTGTNGEFDLVLNAFGSMQQPRVKGAFLLKNGGISVLPLGLHIDTFKGDIRSSDNNNLVLFDTLLESRGEKLQAKGDVKLDMDAGYPYRFSINGEHFPLVRTADLSMDISPELSLSGDMSLHKVRGQIWIPLLDLRVSTLPESAVSISPDVIIVQSREAGAIHVQEANGNNEFVKNQLDIDVGVLLEPEIHLSAFGLDTRLKGDIRISKPQGVAQPRAQGQVTVTEGRYKAYGQNLQIEEGRILFAGPIDNPALNVRAFRPELEVKAGVNVTGSIRQPKLTLYSEPLQTEADTLSYIITGRPLGAASGGEASLIAKAALSLGAQESSMLTGQIAEMFNLDEFSVAAGDTVESTSLNASKKITRDLTFKTAFNPFDQFWSFLLNYKLTENWSVQSETGLRQGADIIYSIESNKFKELYRKFLDLLSFERE